MTRSALSLAAAAFVLAASLPAAPARACTMLPPPRTPPPAAETDRLAREAVERAQAVIEFEVVEGRGRGDATIRVLQTVKGPYAAGAILLARPVDGAACGPGSFATGQRHLVFLSRLPDDGEPILVWRLASPVIRDALIRLGLLGR